MRAGLLLLLSCSPLAGACAGAPRASESTSAFVAEIESLNRELEERFRSGDLLGVADLYADDAVRIDAGSRIEGREAIDAFWSSIPDPRDWSLEASEIGGSEELAYQLGRSRRVGRVGDVEHTTVADFLLIWRKNAEGDWRIAVDASW